VRILITGVTGFVGPHLVDYLTTVVSDAKIWGLVWTTDGGAAPETVITVPGDLTEISSLIDALEESRPDVVFHLAAASSVASSWSRPGRFLEINAVGTVNLLEAVRTLGLSPRIVVSSSAEVYGTVPPDQQPIQESCPLRPVSPYAASKAAQDLLTAQYFLGFGLPTVRLRLFHHTGPRRPPQFVASSFAHQIVRIEKGLDAPRLAVGNLEAVRDFSDVRDIARAYWMAANDGRPGEAYNVCSGHGVRIREVLDLLLGKAQIAVETEVDPARLRAADIARLVGDRGRFTEATGWRPEIPIEQTLEDLLEWWRGEISE
jgi:GDP-4-dehydro-6-deoxy-D-mannose reductase